MKDNQRAQTKICMPFRIIFIVTVGCVYIYLLVYSHAKAGCYSYQHATEYLPDFLGTELRSSAGKHIGTPRSKERSGEDITILDQEGRADTIIETPFQKEHDFTHGLRPKRVHLGSSSKEKLQSYKDIDSDEGNDLFAGLCPIGGNDRHYAAAWLSSLETLLDNHFFSEEFFAGKSPSREFAYFAAVKKVLKTGSVLWTVDMFDFFLHHLSNYEKVLGGYDEAFLDINRQMRPMQDGYIRKKYNNPSDNPNDRVLAILPYFSTGNSVKLQVKKQHLNATVITTANLFPNVVLYLASQSDYEYVTKESGLNKYLYDVQLMTLSDPNFLPYAAVVDVRSKMLKGNYYDEGFGWVYYSESDQLPHMRDVDRILRRALEKDVVLVPHRGQPYPLKEDFILFPPRNITARQHGKLHMLLNTTAQKEVHNVPSLFKASCCFDPTCPVAEPNDGSLVPFQDPRFSLFRQHESFAHVTGTGRCYPQKYRPCQFAARRYSCRPS